MTGDGGFGFGAGEGALLTATTSKEGRRRDNYSLRMTRGSDKNYGCGTIVLQLEWIWSKDLCEELMEGKSGASSRGNTSSVSVY